MKNKEMFTNSRSIYVKEILTCHGGFIPGFANSKSG